MGEHHQAFVRALSLLQLDGFVARRRGRGRPAHDPSIWPAILPRMRGKFQPGAASAPRVLTTPPATLSCPDRAMDFAPRGQEDRRWGAKRFPFARGVR